MKKFGLRAEWREHTIIWEQTIMQILSEGWGDGNDSPYIDKALGEWLELVGI